MLYLKQVWNVLLELAPWLFVGLGAAGLLHVLVPKDFVVKHLGSSRFGSVVKAVLLGVPMPLCSCGVIPAALGIKKQGASDGAAVGFLISTPQTGIDSIFVSASFLGWPFALFKVFSAAVTGLIGGGLTQMIPAKPEETEEPGKKACAAPKKGVKAMFDFAFNELLYMMWGWLAIGILVSAAITTWVPPDAFRNTVLATGILAMLLMLVISLPLYVCATSSVPIAAALVASGMPTGAALVFLMAGPASNLATLGAVYRGFGGKVLGIYLATISLGSIGFGYTFDFVLESAGTGGAIHAHEHTSWISMVCAAILIASLAWFAMRDFRTWLRKQTEGNTVAEELKLNVSGMSCEGCAGKVKEALLAITAVNKVDVDIKSGDVEIGGEGLDEAALREAITGAGFGVN